MNTNNTDKTNIIVQTIDKYKNISVIVFAILFSSICVWYSTQVPMSVDGDEIVVLESEREKVETQYYNSEIVSAMGYKTYMYPKLAYKLSQHFSIPTYKKILLWFLVFCTILASFYSLRLLDFSPLISFGVSMVALMPRFAPVGETIGILTITEVTGRSFALPLVWLLSAWFIQRFHNNQPAWVVFFFIGLLTGVHPVTMVLFFVMSITTYTILILRKENLWITIKKVIHVVFVYAIGASYVLLEIVFRSKEVAGIKDVVDSKIYLEALMYRIPWEKPLEILIWFRHVFIVSAIYFVSLGYAWYLIYKKDIKKDSMQYVIVLWGTISLAVVSVLHIIIPTLQQYAIKAYDAPLIFWQFGRMYKLSYIVLAFVFAVAVTEVWRRHNAKYAIALVILGLLCSSFAFEWFQFVVGYKNYRTEYIPSIFQADIIRNPYEEYGVLCDSFWEVGAKKGDVVLYNDFNLRYFCDLNPHITHEEGSGHIFLGKKSLVYWYETILLQNKALEGDDVAVFQEYVATTGAHFAVVPRDSAVAYLLINEGSRFSIYKDKAIINIETSTSTDKDK